MAWFTRKDSGPPERASVQTGDVTASEGVEPPLRPVVRRLGVEEQQRIARGRSALEVASVDVDDLAALGAAFDVALTQWRGASTHGREGHEAIVERFAIGIGEHLSRHTDLSWALVTDAFGTDLALAAGRDEFVVVPSNLVAARWLNQERSWIPGVVAHLVRVRASR